MAFYQYLEEEEEYYRQQEEQQLRYEQEAAALQNVTKLQSDVAGQPIQEHKDEVKRAADEAAKAAQEAAKAAAEASQGLMKGITSLGGNIMEQSGGFGFGFGAGSNKKGSSGFSIGGFGLGSIGGMTQPAKKPEAAQPMQTILKTEIKPIYDDQFAKPCTARMTAKERWWWAYRMTVQVNARKHLQLLDITLSCFNSLKRFCISEKSFKTLYLSIFRSIRKQTKSVNISSEWFISNTNNTINSVLLASKIVHLIFNSKSLLRM